MDFLERFRNKLVRIIFPFEERFSVAIALVLLMLILLAWSVPQPYWQIRAGIMWLILVNAEINQAGNMERDYLPIQPGSGLFYNIYRFIDRVFFLFFLIWLLLLLTPGPQWLMGVFGGVIVMAMILRMLGDRKYRPKKPEE